MTDSGHSGICYKCTTFGKSTDLPEEVTCPGCLLVLDILIESETAGAVRWAKVEAFRQAWQGPVTAVDYTGWSTLPRFDREWAVQAFIDANDDLERRERRRAQAFLDATSGQTLFDDNWPVALPRTVWGEGW